MDAATVKVVARVGEEGVPFGSVTAQMIADALKEGNDIEIDRRRIDIKTPIKTAGEHVVSVAIYRDIRLFLILRLLLAMLNLWQSLKRKLKKLLQLKQPKKQATLNNITRCHAA